MISTTWSSDDSELDEEFLLSPADEMEIESYGKKKEGYVCSLVNGKLKPMLD